MTSFTVALLIFPRYNFNPYLNYSLQRVFNLFGSLLDIVIFSFSCINFVGLCLEVFVSFACFDKKLNRN